MKSVFQFSFILAALFLCCSNGKANNDGTPVDVRTFGMIGSVKEVHLSICNLASDSEGDPWLQKDELQMSFDKVGKVTLDLYSNVYLYDSKGNFLKGAKGYEIMKRNNKGQIISYESQNKQDEEDVDCYFFEFTYDDMGRMTTMSLTLWESTYKDTIFYTGNNVYPDKIITEGDDEGEHTHMETTYEYQKFDAKGNWTERECRTETRITEEFEEGVTQENTITLEKREITYW